MIEWHNSHSQCQVAGPFHAPGQIYRVTGQIQYCPDIMTGHIVKVSESTAHLSPSAVVSCFVQLFWQFLGIFHHYH